MNVTCKISVVTVNFNNSKGLEKTINSVINQTCLNKIEFIVIDGCSTDDSLEVIKKNQNHITHFVCERDRGIYDAMNKGLYYCTSDFVLFLNSGDVFVDNHIVNRVINCIDDLDTFYFGTVKVVYEDMCWEYPNKNISKSNVNLVDWLKYNTPNHQACFFPRSFYMNNSYNLNYKIVSDHEYKLRCMNDCNVKFLQFVISKFDYGGVTSFPKRYKTVFKICLEYFIIFNKYKKDGFHLLKFTLNMQLKYILYLFLSKRLYFKFIVMLK